MATSGRKDLKEIQIVKAHYALHRLIQPELRSNDPRRSRQNEFTTNLIRSDAGRRLDQSVRPVHPNARPIEARDYECRRDSVARRYFREGGGGRHAAMRGARLIEKALVHWQIAR